MTVSGEIIKVLDALSEKLGIAIDWTQQNVLPQIKLLCDKVVAYEMWSSIMWIVFAAISVALFVIFLRIAMKQKWWTFEGYKAGWGRTWTTMISSIVTFIICAIIIGIQFSDILRCVVFPESVVLDFIKTNL